MSENTEEGRCCAVCRTVPGRAKRNDAAREGAASPSPRVQKVPTGHRAGWPAPGLEGSGGPLAPEYMGSH